MTLVLTFLIFSLSSMWVLRQRFLSQQTQLIEIQFFFYIRAVSLFFTHIYLESDACKESFRFYLYNIPLYCWSYCRYFFTWKSWNGNFFMQHFSPWQTVQTFFLNWYNSDSWPLMTVNGYYVSLSLMRLRQKGGHLLLSSEKKGVLIEHPVLLPVYCLCSYRIRVVWNFLLRNTLF